MKPKAPKTAVFSVRLPAELREALHEKCEEDGISVVQFIRDAAEAYIEDRLVIRPGRGNLPSYFDVSGKPANKRRRKQDDPPAP